MKPGGETTPCPPFQVYRDMRAPGSPKKLFSGTPAPASPLKRKNVPGSYPANTRSQSITMISNAMRRMTTHSRKFECWILTSSDSIE